MEYYGTLGPACGSVQTLKEMLAAGMTGVRLNLSHGDLEENGHWIRMVQEAGRELHSQVQILMDLRGPELRLGRFKEGSRQKRAAGWSLEMEAFRFRRKHWHMCVRETGSSLTMGRWSWRQKPEPHRPPADAGSWPGWSGAGS